MASVCMIERVHPLAALAAASPDCAAVQLTALSPATRFLVRGGAAAVASIGMDVPAPCRAVISGDRALLWLGPEEFLLLLPVGEPFSGIGAAGVVDVSHRNTALSVSGPR